jgi:di/tricarboxylate transporter
MAGGLALLLVSGILEPAEALGGFANESLLTVVVLFVVAAGISETKGLDHIFSSFLGHPKTLLGAQVRVLLPVAVVSAVFNNTVRPPPVGPLLLCGVHTLSCHHTHAVLRLNRKSFPILTTTVARVLMGSPS